MIFSLLFKGIQIFLACVIGFFFLYLVFLTLLAFLYRRKKDFHTQRHNTFAVIVPAHNEAVVIESTLQNLFAIDYPKDKFDIIVVADNCTDDTSAIAKRNEATVFERNNPDFRGKGYALRWCFDKILSGDRKSYDAVVVIDADSTVAQNFLTVMNYYLESGAKAMQCSDLVENASSGWTIEMIRLSFLLYNYVRPLGRSIIGCSAGLKGNGMCFSVDVLSTIPWESFSLNEDLEYGLELLLHGIHTQFVPEAKLLAKMPQNAKNAQSQRIRWEAGRYPVIRKFAGKLFVGGFTKRSLALFDAFVMLVTPSLANMLLIAGGMFAVNMVLPGMSDMIVLWSGIILLGMTHVLLGIIAGKGNLSVFVSLIHIPRYLLWKVWLFLGNSRKNHKTGEWVRTTREDPENNIQGKIREQK